MKLKDNPDIKQIPRFSGGSYSHLDRLYLPHTEIFLSKVEISNAGDLELIAKPVDGGSEQWRDWLKLKRTDETKIKILLNWLNARIGDTIDSIFKSEFSFEN